MVGTGIQTATSQQAGVKYETTFTISVHTLPTMEDMKRRCAMMVVAAMPGRHLGRTTSSCVLVLVSPSRKYILSTAHDASLGSNTSRSLGRTMEHVATAMQVAASVWSGMLVHVQSVKTLQQVEL
jgi:hypothetical protein